MSKSTSINVDVKAILAKIEEFNKIQWGYDGDCGAQAIVDAIEEIINKP